MTHDEISKLSDAEISEQIITAVQKANDNPQLCYAVFHIDSNTDDKKE